MRWIDRLKSKEHGKEDDEEEEKAEPKRLDIVFVPFIEITVLGKEGECSECAGWMEGGG